MSEPSAPPGTPALEISNLRVTYRTPTGTVPAVRGVDLTVGPGEIVGLVGESGSGKSSVCSAILGLAGPAADVQADVLSTNGTDLRDLDRRGWEQVRGRRLALVPQQPMTALVPTVAVGRQLDWYLGPGAVEHHRDDLVDLGLEVITERPGDLPDSFSGGQLQRLVIAMTTLAHRPAVLLADEPTSTLDATVAASVLDLLVARRDEGGLAIVLVSHDLATVAERCDRVAVMHRGRIVEDSPTDALFRAPSHPYSRALIDAIGPSSVPGSAPAAPPRAPVLELDRIYHYYGRSRTTRRDPRPGAGSVTRAVDEVTIRVDEATTTALVGESGSGKTTLARVAVGAIAPTAGTVLLDGRELSTDRSLQDRRAVQLVGQNPRAAFNRRRRIGHAFEQAQRVHGIGSSRSERDDASREMARLVGLRADHLARRPGDLSGGELARAQLARALLLSPRVLLLDEPTASLDPRVKAAVLHLLADLRDSLSLSMLVITHELPTARMLADRVAVVERGRLVEEGPVSVVLGAPEHPYTRSLLASEPPDPRPPTARPH